MLRDSRHDRAAPASGPSAPDRGELIGGRYRVERALGSGGMAHVFEVCDGRSDRRLALKRLARKESRRSLALFEREYHTLSSLHHPNIVEVYEYAADDRGPYYTMELLHGSDLSMLAPRPWNEACSLLRELASALALLHARGYVHRDISARNVWWTDQHRVKLIDFGTLSPFGRSVEVAGTPPFIAPEVVDGSELDRRTDLYALGALGYWLLTGMHAFPARSLHALQPLWQVRPRPASQRVAELGRKDLPEVPPALDQLLEALLSRDPRARPNDAAELIDALCAIAGLPAESHPLVVESYLDSPVLVGRSAQIDLLSGALARAHSGQGASVLLEATAGMGRSRMLAELSLNARLASAVVVQAEGDGQHGVLELYALKLLDALPVEALNLAQPFAPVLGHLSPELRDRLCIPEYGLTELPKAHGEARMRMLGALCDWFLEVARTSTLVILADDVHAFDQDTNAWLAALGHQSKQRRLLIVATLLTDQAGHASVEGLRKTASRIALGPLEPHEVEAMLRSVFGKAPHVQRLSDVVSQHAEGNPGQVLDLLAHLVQRRLVQYVDGEWVLPTGIAPSELPKSPRELLAARVRSLAADARALGQALSVRQGFIPFEACVALSERSIAETLGALEDLVREGVLSGSAEGYRFTRAAVRTRLFDELDASRKQRLHRISGELLLQSDAASMLERLEGGLHLLLGGDVERGTLVVAEAAQHYGLVEIAEVGQAGAALERALELFLQLHRPPHELLSLYAPLALAGYYAERRYADRYAEPTLALLQALLGLTDARRLAPLLGKKAALYASLGKAAARFHLHRHNPRVPTFRKAMMLLFNCVAALTGVCTVCVDAERARRYADVLEPLRALGDNHVATLMHDFCLNLSLTVQDRAGYARQRWQRMIERLESGERIRDLPDDVRILYLAGALYACGVMECWRDSSQALQFAQRLEDFKLKLYDLSANQIRMMYYGHQGHTELMHKYRERVELHAIQRGTAWQVETWAFAAMVSVYSRTHNALGVKHCVQQLKQLSAELPSLERLIRRTQAAYWLLRGLPAEVLSCIDANDEPLASAGWARARGSLAAAYNLLGEHARAKQICLDALQHLTHADLAFPAMTLSLPIELALAEAGLGNFASATARLDGLIEQHGPHEGALTLSALHEARMQVAAMMHDPSALEHHLASMQRWQRSTGDRGLIASGERRAKHARATVGDSGTLQPGGLDAVDSAQPLTVLQRLRHGGDSTLEGSAEWIIDRLIEYADIRAGHVFATHGDVLHCVASRGEIPDPEVFEDWLVRCLALDDEAPTVQVDHETDPVDPDRFSYRGRSYRLLRLTSEQNGRAELTGALVLSEATVFELPRSVLRAIADRLRASAGSLSA